MLVKSEGNILNAPWLCEKARLVKSTSSPHPHIVTTHKTNTRLYCCDDKCAMYAGFSICSHVVAVAECNGDLKSFLDAASATCAPNLSAIASQGLPRGAGRKGGVPKRKRKTPVPIQSRLVRPCLVNIGATSSTSQESSNSQPSPALSTACSSIPQQGTNDCDLQSLLQTLGRSTVQSSAVFPVQSPTLYVGASSSSTLQNLQQPCISPSIRMPPTSVSQSASQGQLGTGVNLSIPSSVLQSLSMASNSRNSLPGHTDSRISKPFTLKLKTKQIKVCQSCRKDFEGENDTLGLVFAHPERKIISNPLTGAQFLGKESNSHYHANMVCPKKVDSSFEIDVPKDLLPKLTIFQKVYLMTCLNSRVP